MTVKIGKDGRHLHGLSKTRLYRIWSCMKNRCSNKNRLCFADYGARGISVCDEWMAFERFFEWATSNGYSDNLTIERIDVNKGYSPDNCKWIPFVEQSLNKTSTVYVEYNGERHPISVWAEKIGASKYSLYSRKSRGWTDREIIETPLVRGGKRSK